ncbi:hypothetical protein GS931_17865 [Rhodococcus hoagii]|nr:hypothetical protein [Prescottella equi]
MLVQPWVLLVGIDLLYYTYHRMAHRIRLIWATHQAHHSSEYFNFATALRQKWNNRVDSHVDSVATDRHSAVDDLRGFSVSLVYQFFVHTERFDRLPRPIEYVFNTPSHHRVHHGCDPEYLDRNYGGILIVWDRCSARSAPSSNAPPTG